jgi:hypothetical protein
VTTERVLVDTSAWITGFRRTGHPGLKEFLRYCISSGFAATCPVVILELLQGCKTEAERDNLRIKLESLDVFPITQPTWERLYELGFSLGRAGLTLPTTDLIIAAVALEHDAIVVHQDQHYELIGRHSRLRTKHFRQKL